MKLYAKPSCHRTKRMVALAKINEIDVKICGADGQPSEQFGKIPVLDTGKGCIFSANAIARYLSRMRPDIGLYGQNFIESGEVDSWVEFSVHELEIPVCVWVYPLQGISPDVPEATAHARADVTEALSSLDKHLLLRT